MVKTLALLALVLVLASCDWMEGPTHPKILDPCYSPTIHVDTLTMRIDSTTWEWTPGGCEN